MKLHPFVKAFYKRERTLLELIADYTRQNDPLIGAFKQIFDCYETPAKTPATLQTLARLPMASADPSLAALLYVFWGELSLSHGNVMEALALQRRQKSLLSPSVPPDLAASVATLDAEFAVASGDVVQAERVYREQCERTDLTPAYRLRMLSGYIDLLAEQGRARDALELQQKLIEQHPDPRLQGQWTMHSCTNNLETGHTDAAAREFSIWANDPNVKDLFSSHVIHCRNLLMLLRRDWNHGSVPSPDNAAETRAPAWAWATRALQEGRVELALVWAKRHAQRHLGALTTNNFTAFTLLRAQLAAKNMAGAEHWLHLRGNRRLSHYLDDFFRARVAWLKGKPDEAAICLARALKAVSHYRAEGRLDFEFSLAIDMSPSDVARLCRMAGEQRAIAPPAARRRSSARLPAVADPGALVGASTATKKLREVIRRFAPLPAPVLITGETGTGKDVAAHALHDAGPRRKQPFIAVNCGAIAESLLESELFGHVRGAFTGAEREHKGVFEEAGTGTLFLDEIGEITSRLQVALLRVLESGEIRPVGGNRARKTSCRLIFATNVDLDAAVAAGRFRRDLFYRLRRLSMHILPLRERREDILPLAKHFLRLGWPSGSAVRLSPDLEAALERRPWRGNVRELRNEMERMVWLSPGREEYGVTDLGEPDAAAALTQEAPAVTYDAHVAEAAAEPRQEAWQSRTSFRRIDQLRALFQQHRKLSRLEVVHLLRVAPNTAASYLQQLCADGFIARVEPTPAPRSHYFVLKT